MEDVTGFSGGKVINLGAVLLFCLSFGSGGVFRAAAGKVLTTDYDTRPNRQILLHQSVYQRSLSNNIIIKSHRRLLILELYLRQHLPIPCLNKVFFHFTLRHATQRLAPLAARFHL